MTRSHRPSIFDFCAPPRQHRHPAAAEPRLAHPETKTQISIRVQKSTEKVQKYKFAIGKSELSSMVVRIASAMAKLVGFHYFSTFRGVRVLGRRFRVLEPKMRSQNRQLPQVACLLDCPFQKLGSRMDAPIFVFNRYMKFHTFGPHFNR